jgi:hypothetical protein
MDRRGFLGSILAACAAPAIVRASSLMQGRGIVVASLAETISYGGGNQLVTANAVAREMLEILRGSLLFTSDMNNEYEAGLRNTNASRAPIRIQRPMRFG